MSPGPWGSVLCAFTLILIGIMAFSIRIFSVRTRFL